MGAMELFRGDGRLTQQLRITDHRGERRQLSMHTTSRITALRIAQKIELLIDYRMRGDSPPADLLLWLEDARPSIRAKLMDWGIVPPAIADAGRRLTNDPPPPPALKPAGWTDPPPSLVDLWEGELAEREVTPLYSEQSAQRVRVLLAMPGDGKALRYIHDVTAAGILLRIRDLRKIGPPQPATAGKRPRHPLSPQTCEHYLAKAREFMAWLVRKGYLKSNPLVGVQAYSPEVIREKQARRRRPFTLQEQGTLIHGTATLAHRWGMEGAERSLIYRLALRTGLRAKEIRTLTVSSFDLYGRTVTVLAAEAKARRRDTLPLAAELVPLLKAHFAGKLPQACAFTPLSPKRYCRMLVDDLNELGIVYHDAQHGYADFHALRHTFCTDLARVTMPAVHQTLARHSDIHTTMKFYTHVQAADQASALAKLPPLPEAPPAIELTN